MLYTERKMNVVAYAYLPIILEITVKGLVWI